MDFAIWFDERSGWLRVGDGAPGAVVELVEGGLDWETDGYDRLLETVRRVRTGELASFERAYNCARVVLTADHAALSVSWTPHVPPCRLPLDVFEDVLRRARAAVQARPI